MHSLTLQLQPPECTQTLLHQQVTYYCSYPEWNPIAHKILLILPSICADHTIMVAHVPTATSPATTNSAESLHHLCGARLQIHPERALITGHYRDELSLHRARRSVTKILSEYFLIDPDTDFLLQAKSSLETGEHTLWCFFTSACGRCACWRLNNGHALEAMACLEVAHLAPTKEYSVGVVPGAKVAGLSLPPVPRQPPPVPAVLRPLTASMGIMETIKSVLTQIIELGKNKS